MTDCAIVQSNLYLLLYLYLSLHFCFFVYLCPLCSFFHSFLQFFLLFFFLSYFTSMTCSFVLQTHLFFGQFSSSKRAPDMCDLQKQAVPLIYQPFNNALQKLLHLYIKNHYVMSLRTPCYLFPAFTNYQVTKHIISIKNHYSFSAEKEVSITFPRSCINSMKMTWYWTILCM